MCVVRPDSRNLYGIDEKFTVILNLHISKHAKGNDKKT